jgi:methanogenic corrinoid protein MtbC1
MLLLISLGNLLLDSPEPSSAEPFFAESKIHLRALGETSYLPYVAHGLGEVARNRGDLDTAAAHAIVSEALAATSLEAVCVGLLQPALNRIGELWAHRQITMPEERFALNYIRAFLFSHFHATAERPAAPMVFIGCGPREYNDLGALMLATFCRHAGLRTIYLGQDVDASHLVQESRTRRPALIALTITTSQRVRALSRLARELQQGPTPHPIFAFGGPIFARNPELQRRVSGIYLGDDITTATWHLRRLLGLNRQTEAHG